MLHTQQKHKGMEPPKEYCVHENGLELLAPAGSFIAAKAVIHAGADAVYLGGARFGARAYADNFTKEELLEIIDYAHLHGRKIYLTVNTLLKQPEMEALYDYLFAYYEQGLDAVIVQDYGVMQHIRNCFPKLPIHISTQMSVADAHGAAYLKSRGAARIVTARELSLKEIQNIHKQVDIEIECFVHGALCYCYSGQCLFSSMLGGRSGNRGRCAQPCRLPYTVLDEDRHPLSRRECYPLSPKDLCAIEQIPELAQAGVYSFKIEGRMKSAEYAAGVVSVYRNYIDAYLKNGSFLLKEQDIRHLSDAGSRSGFTKGYYHQHNGSEMITMDRPAYEKNNTGYLNAIREKYAAKEQKIPVCASAALKRDKPSELTVSVGDFCISVQDDLVQAAEKQPVSREMVIQQLSKTGNTPYMIKSMEVIMDDNIFLPKQVLNRLRRSALENLTQFIIAPYRRKTSPVPQRIPEPKAQAISTDSRKPLFYASVENERQLLEVLDFDFIHRIYVDSSMYPRKGFAAHLARHVTLIRNSGKQAYFVLPGVFRMKTARFYQEHWQEIEQTGIDGYLIKGQDELGFINERRIDKRRCVLDHNLYTWSDDTKAYYAAEGGIYDTVSLELNKKELSGRNNTASELIIYGYMPLMTSAQCIFQTLKQCDGTQRLCYLKDRYAKEFPVKNNCIECCNTIYNAQPLSLIHLPGEVMRLQPVACRLHFTIESPEETGRILSCCEQSFLKSRIPDLAEAVGAYTKGHFKRGVE